MSATAGLHIFNSRFFRGSSRLINLWLSANGYQSLWQGSVRFPEGPKGLSNRSVSWRKVWRRRSV